MNTFYHLFQTRIKKEKKTFQIVLFTQNIHWDGAFFFFFSFFRVFADFWISCQIRLTFWKFYKKKLQKRNFFFFLFDRLIDRCGHFAQDHIINNPCGYWTHWVAANMCKEKFECSYSAESGARAARQCWEVSKMMSLTTFGALGRRVCVFALKTWQNWEGNMY